jgi:hypothetical protein
MLALPECGFTVSCDSCAEDPHGSQAQMSGVAAPQPLCSKPGFGTAFAVVACAAGATPSTSDAAVAIRSVRSTFILHPSLGSASMATSWPLLLERADTITALKNRRLFIVSP